MTERTKQIWVPPIKYNDLYFRLAVCLIASHIMIMMGRPFSSLHAFTIPTYYPTLLINYVIALLVAYSVRRITLKLDRYYSWDTSIWVRGSLQFLFGVCLVSILSFLLVFIYFAAFGRDIMASSYPKYEFPFSIGLITILNLYYVVAYFVHQLNHVRKFVPIRQGIANELEEEPVIDVEEYQIEDTAEIKPQYKEIIIVDTPIRSIPVRVEEIAYFYILEKSVFMMLFNMQSTNESYSHAEKLVQLEDSLDPKLFFRINRQCIVNFTAIREFRPHSDKCLIVSLVPNPMEKGNSNNELMKKICIVSVDRVAAFKNWMDR